MREKTLNALDGICLGRIWTAGIAIFLMSIIIAVGVFARYVLAFGALLVDLAVAAICLFGLVYGSKLCLGTMGQNLAELSWLPVGIPYAPLPLGGLLTFIFVFEKLASRS